MAHITRYMVLRNGVPISRHIMWGTRSCLEPCGAHIVRALNHVCPFRAVQPNRERVREREREMNEAMMKTGERRNLYEQQ